MFFSFVLHNHQPVGQVPWAFTDAWRESYQPFLDTLAEFPGIKAGLHFSGPLLEWLAAERPATVAQVADLAGRGQVELLCGGYYEPIFVIWPRADALAQIARSQARVEELFGVRPRGLWLTERVWEPQLAQWFTEAGVEYTLLDGTLFEAAGLAQAQTHGAFQFPNSPLRVFPINRTMRDLIPWHEPHETIAYLRHVHESEGNNAHVLFGDDGEKFGAWPGTHEWVFEQGWLRRFFEALEAESGWLQTITPGDYLQNHAPLQTVALEAGSYPEMQEWSGGNWRNFLERYHESRDMQSEVLRTSAVVAPEGEAYESILRAQSNDAYWHGVFGGLYLKHLRQAIYAECASARHSVAGDEVLIERSGNEVFAGNAFLRLGARSHGGHLFFLTESHTGHNLLATLRRYAEPYQNEGAPVDWYGRGALLDHFFDANVTQEEFQNGRFREEGDFISEEWQVETQAGEGEVAILLRREGGVWHAGVFAPLLIEKKIQLAADANELQVEYRLHNPGEAPLELWWGVEWNAVLSGSQLPERYYQTAGDSEKRSLEEPGEYATVTGARMVDEWLGLQIEWQFPSTVALWHVPIETVSQKEGGEVERNYQQSAMVFHRRVNLVAGGEYRTAFQVGVEKKTNLE